MYFRFRSASHNQVGDEFGADFGQGPGDGDDDVMDAFDAHVDADVDLGGGLDGDDGPGELELILGIDGLGDDGADEGLQGVEIDALDAFDAAEDSECEDAPDVPDLPHYDLGSGRVTSRDDPPEPLGRISLIKVGTPQEAVSVYCRRHGCSFMKGCRVAPSNDDMLAWFRAGMEIPKGRDPALQTRHKRLFPK